MVKIMVGFLVGLSMVLGVLNLLSELYLWSFLRSVSDRANLRNARVPLWFVGVGAGLAALVLLGVFFFGAYSGLGSSL
jgi:photosystem II PsbJ protein